jgi:hypothetical protein
MEMDAFITKTRDVNSNLPRKFAAFHCSPGYFGGEHIKAGRSGVGQNDDRRVGFQDVKQHTLRSHIRSGSLIILNFLPLMS